MWFLYFHGCKLSGNTNPSLPSTAEVGNIMKRDSIDLFHTKRNLIQHFSDFPVKTPHDERRLGFSSQSQAGDELFPNLWCDFRHLDLFPRKESYGKTEKVEEIDGDLGNWGDRD